MSTFYRLQIVLHTPTMRVGHVQTDPIGNLPRKTIPVVLNTTGDPVVYLPACECVSLGYTWATAIATLASMTVLS